MNAAYVRDAVRTPFGRHRGALAATRADDVAAARTGRAPLARIAGRGAVGVDPDLANALGGAIAIGHPLGASGARVVGAVAHQLRRRGGGWGLAAVCIGVGQGLAVVLEGVAA